MKKTKKKEKQEQKGAEANIGLHPRLQALLDTINKMPPAKEALRTLVEGGCDRTVVLTNLFYYCGGSAKELRIGLKAAINFPKQLGRVSGRLVEDAGWVEVMQEKCRRYGTPFYGPGFVDLPKTMRHFADVLTTLGEMYGPGLKNVRLGDEKRTRSKSETRGRVNTTAGRTQHLVYLAYYVKGESERPVAEHYRLLANLVSAVREDENRVLDNIVDSLRNNVTAFAKRRPMETWVIAEEAEAEFEEKNSKPQGPARK